MALIHIDRPKNVSNETLDQDEFLSKCEVLYKENDDGLYEFQGMYNPDIPDEEYPDGMAAFSFRSVYVGTETLKANTSVWNVIGSTGDYWDGKVCSNWLGVWNTKTGNNLKSETGTCFVKGSVKTNNTNNCNGISVGGHIVKDGKKVKPGKDDSIYIIPICQSHNFYTNKAEMKVSEDVPAVKMNKFMQKGDES